MLWLQNNRAQRSMANNLRLSTRRGRSSDSSWQFVLFWRLVRKQARFYSAGFFTSDERAVGLVYGPCIGWACALFAKHPLHVSPIRERLHPTVRRDSICQERNILAARKRT